MNGVNSTVDKPMGNAELRLTLAGIESEIGDVKSIALDTRKGQQYTNGKVMWLTKTAWLSMGALPLLTIWAGWLTKEVLERPKEPLNAEQQAQVIQAAVNRAFDDNIKPRP